MMIRNNNIKNRIDSIFDHLDSWRLLPAYQLERRADIFFSLYLPEVLEAKLGFPIVRKVVPEFPVRIGTIDPDISTEKSYKIDYVCLSADGQKAILVELKTEMKSRRIKQDEYLIASRNKDFSELLGGVLDIFRATKSKRKYFNLLKLLECMELLRIPIEMKKIMSRPKLQGVTKVSQAVKIARSVNSNIIIYVQPSGNGKDIITFEEFRAVVKKYDDPVSLRFAKSLREWSGLQA